ncbi:DNA-deoxyinosine glycosylase [Candidatus Mycobacterium methanotrophicum]|uniref:DNA-deoxyinosine glycosylase n=1 Tax=Candidatus Mycobacterium methanotrophicum TaxID=2943498 RepID=A0ABY4QI11_9MYCO|nr:DNA-deoxyinosine glycosylase [Candidatus Mycobacterium methanotrophicum]UQX09631.1 DNA-deoxyinosine glycosylase [Candidatus Mycobacterium methanotrophicum]
MATSLLEGFAPVVDDDAGLLILGSFPSVQSLAARQYYGNRRNAFWPITSALFGFDAQAAYETRLTALQSHGVALWDVLHKCRRVGSSDAKIDPTSLVVNGFAQLFATYPGIERVYFNGHTADKLFRRLVHVDAPVSYRVLPSTSPARAMPAGQKLQAWREISQS